MNSPAPSVSLTSQAVALVRAGLERPHTPLGDPGAQRALCAGLTFTPPDWLRPGIEARTRFIDQQVLAAIARGVRQVVICGAGLDDRALRLRAPGVRFTEVDHPATQADKARRLAAMAASADRLTLAACDFRTGSVAQTLDGCGHDQGQQTLFVCEGLLLYLDPMACSRLLEDIASRAAPGSTLAVTLAIHADGLDSAEVVANANARRRAGASEPWLTILPAADHLAMLAQAGWRVTAVEEAPAAHDDVSHGRRTLLVSAVADGPGA
jgi:methyltransferase (TIGR00027 family)